VTEDQCLKGHGLDHARTEGKIVGESGKGGKIGWQRFIKGFALRWESSDTFSS